MSCYVLKAPYLLRDSDKYSFHSVGGAIWNNLLPDKLAKYLPAEGKQQAQAIYKSIVTAKKFAKGSEMRAAIDLSYRETQQTLAIAATAALAPMLFVMFALKNVDLGKRQAEQEHDSDEEEQVPVDKAAERAEEKTVDREVKEL